MSFFKWNGPVRAFLCVWDSGCVGGKWILAIISIFLIYFVLGLYVTGTLL